MATKEEVLTKLIEIANLINSNEDAMDRILPGSSYAHSHFVSVKRLHEEYIYEVFNQHKIQKMYHCVENAVVGLWSLHRILGANLALNTIDELLTIAADCHDFNQKHRHHLFQHRSYQNDFEELRQKISTAAISVLKI